MLIFTSYPEMENSPLPEALSDDFVESDSNFSQVNAIILRMLLRAKVINNVDTNID